MNVIVELITPERATELLKLNTRNRRIRTKHVLNMSRQMERGEWRVTHQPIAISSDGALLDGQHRLAAVVKCGLPVKMSVAYGVSPDIFGTIDVGAIRDTRDHFGNVPVLYGIARLARFVDPYPTPGQIQVMFDLLRAETDFFNANASNAKKKIFSSGPISAAALYTMWREGPSRFHRVVDIYNGMLHLMDDALLPPVAKSFIHQAAVGTLTKKQNVGGGNRDYWLFAKAERVFSFEHKDDTQIKIHNAQPIIDEVRDRLTTALKEAAKPAPLLKVG